MTQEMGAGEGEPDSQDGVRYRPGTLADTRAINEVSERSFDDLALRSGWSGGEPIDEAGIERELQAQLGLYQHLATTAERFWVAERGGKIVGVARSIRRDDVRQLTELFVLPEAQGFGIGGELLRRAFPVEGADNRFVLATADLPALAQYLKAGLTIRFPNYGFHRAPEVVSIPNDLLVEPVTASPEVLEEIGRIDAEVLGFRRDVDHSWLLGDRQGYLYRRGDKVVGYGYAGRLSGPFALRDPADFPAVLAHAESTSARESHTDFGVVVPMVNEVAIGYLLERGFRLDPFFSYLMSDRSFGHFEHYIETTPTFFL